MSFWNVFKLYPKNKMKADGQIVYPDSQKLLPSLNEVKRASRRALPGNVTVEAAIAMPLFLFAAVNLLSMILMFQEFSIQEGQLHQTGRELSLFAYGQDDSAENDIRLVKVSRVKAVFPIAAFSSEYFVNGCVMYKWIGYDPGCADGIAAVEKENMVYVTAVGEAYHQKRSCTFLNPSLKLISQEEAKVSTNSDGVRYTACKTCGGSSQIVYVTDYGVRYHSTVSCGGLKRSVDCISETQAMMEGLHACPKCGA